MSHNKRRYSMATAEDLPFIMDTYNANIEALHGADRSIDVWKELIADENCQYYIVHQEQPVAWFRIDVDDKEPDTAWLGMLQVNPVYHRQGIGK